MHVIRKKEHIYPYVSQDPKSVQSRDLMRWYDEVISDTWLGAADLQQCHPNASNVGGKQWSFPLVRSGLTVFATVIFDGDDGLVKIDGVS